MSFAPDLLRELRDDADEDVARLASRGLELRRESRRRSIREQFTGIAALQRVGLIAAVLVIIVFVAQLTNVTDGDRRDRTEVQIPSPIPGLTDQESNTEAPLDGGDASVEPTILDPSFSGPSAALPSDGTISYRAPAGPSGVVDVRIGAGSQTLMVTRFLVSLTLGPTLNVEPFTLNAGELRDFRITPTEGGKVGALALRAGPDMNAPAVVVRVARTFNPPALSGAGTSRVP